MADSIIVAIITVLGAFLTQLVISRAAQKETLSKIEKQSDLQDAKLDAKIEKHQAVTDTKIDELTREVREHNHFARRLPVVEEQINTLNREMKEVKAKVG